LTRFAVGTGFVVDEYRAIGRFENRSGHDGTLRDAVRLVTVVAQDRHNDMLRVREHAFGLHDEVSLVVRVVITAIPGRALDSDFFDLDAGETAISGSRATQAIMVIDKNLVIVAAARNSLPAVSS
jgi:hypothetical protein